MTEKQISFDREAFLNDMRASVEMIDKAVNLGEVFASAGMERLLLVGCGAPHYMFRAINTWIGSVCKADHIIDIYPVELAQARYTPDAKTGVVFGSHSGKTAETVHAAESLQAEKCMTAAITQRADSALGQNAQHVLAYGATQQGYFSAVMLTLAMVSGYLAKTSPDWDLHDALLSSLPYLPKALADAKETTMAEGIHNAEVLQEKTSLYVVGNGPMYTTAYVFSACFLMEMQRMNAHPIKTLDFFHGPFELLDASSPVILLMGEGIFRAEDERARAFYEKYLSGCLTYDSASFDMAGIDPRVRPIAAPFAVDAALTNVVEQLAILREHPLDIRRYMGKVAY